MKKEIIDKFKTITSEEKKIVSEDHSISRELYSSEADFVVDSAKLLERGKYIAMRPHTRSAYFPEHRHNYIEMLVMLEGSLTTSIVDGDTIKLNVGDILLMNRHARHEIMPCGADDIAVNLIILPEFFSRNSVSYDRENVLRDFIISSLSEKKRYSDYILYHTKGVLTVENLMENLLWTLSESHNEMNQIVNSTMDLLLMNLAALSGDTLKDMGSKARNITISSLEYIDQNFRNGTLEELASKTGYSTAYLSRLLKSNTGKNFKQLLQQRKLQQSAYFLENTTLTTERIIEEIGYENSAYFYRKFAEKYGCSPRDYRKRAGKGQKIVVRS